MPHKGAFGLVLTLHVLGAVLLVGPLAASGLLLPLLVRTGQPALPLLRPVPRLLRLAAAGTLGVAALGAVLVNRGPFGSVRGFGDGWLAGSLVLWAVAVVLTVTAMAGGVAGAVADIERTGALARGRLARLAAAGLVATACWCLVVVLMVVKPGS
ncbi:MAG: hypothetical protein IRZ08_21020 [Frankia sp.]|nr:hypothetical protein [Frankia sp.]